MKNTGIKLTVFTVFTIFVTFWLASVIGNLSPFESNYAVSARFSDATGILKGDPVTVAGVTVGKITGFRVDKGDAILDLQLEDHVELPVNAIAEIRYRNLLGQRVLNFLEPKEPSSDLLEDGDQIPLANTRAPLDLSVVFNNLRPLIQSTNPEDINTVARSVLKIFKGREGDLAGILGNVGEIADSLTARGQRFARLITSLDQVTQVLNGQSSSIKTSLSEFTSFMEGLEEVTPTIEKVVDQLDDASTRFGRVLTNNRSNIEQELEDLNTVLGIVNDNLTPLAKVSQNLKEVFLATARSQSYGKWWNLYVVNFCPELGTGRCTALLEGGL
ncbi:MAG: MCE family protein [Actinomycetota bacterium]|nr:MCE family protein [Actinomycetota bacterium]